jgi:CysZ protein
MAEAGAMRRHYGGTTLLAGVLLAGLMVVPVLNLVTPLFGIALMVHVHKSLSRRTPVAGPQAQPRLR